LGLNDFSIEEQDKESVHVRIDKDLYTNLEKLRVKKHSKIVVNRSDIYNETLFYGYGIQKIKEELGDKDFEKFWTMINKLNLREIDISKLI
jgi:hypothetical protein